MRDGNSTDHLYMQVADGLEKMISDDVLKIQGCVLGGVFCGGENWTRVVPAAQPAPPPAAQKMPGRPAVPGPAAQQRPAAPTAQQKTAAQAAADACASYQ